MPHQYPFGKPLSEDDAKPALNMELAKLHLKGITHLYIAYSGGMDSHALLHWAHQKAEQHSIPITALHIHHGLSPNADNWLHHCQTVCDQIGIPLLTDKAEGLVLGMANLEAKARYARYRCFSQQIPDKKGQCLLLAHHADDQLETLIFHLMRKTGLHALMGMPRERKHDHFFVQRPFLPISHQTLHHYAQQHRLNWINDESNLDTSISRNRIRHLIRPQLSRIHPGFEAQLLLLQRLAKLNDRLVKKMAQLDIKTNNSMWPNAFTLEHWCCMDNARKHQALRLWLEALGCTQPTHHHLQTLINQLDHRKNDQSITMNCQKGCIRYWNNQLHWLRKTTWHTPWKPIVWHDLQSPITLPNGDTYRLLSTSHPPTSALTLHFREGGERFCLQGKTHTTTLKAFFNAHKIPPWLRCTVPLFYQNKICIAIGDLAFTKEGHQHYGTKGHCFKKD